MEGCHRLVAPASNFGARVLDGLVLSSILLGVKGRLLLQEQSLVLVETRFEAHDGQVKRFGVSFKVRAFAFFSKLLGHWRLRHVPAVDDLAVHVGVELIA